tara:strand:- start:535 stop:906 length:372 start_codon:yes stop_codon:yes gene_type:complete
MALFRDISNTSRETSAARSWVMFNGTGTVSIYTSFNISSITDAGTGQYRVNLSNGMPNNQYCCLVTGTAGQSSGGNASLDTTSFGGNGSNYPNSSTSYQIRGVNGSGNTQDMEWVNSATWRED